MRQPMKSADPHALRRNTEHLLDTPAHFIGSLVGEGDRKNAPGRGLFDLDQPGNTVHQHAGFAGAGTSQHQLLTEAGGDRLALGVI